MTITRDNEFDRDENRDPITDEPGAHPVGAGVGAALGGAAAGAAAGMAAGPIGTVAGAIIGGVAGGLAGKAVAEQIDPSIEDHHWRNEYMQSRLLRSDDWLRRGRACVSVWLGVAGRVRGPEMGRCRAGFGARMDESPRQIVAGLGPCTAGGARRLGSG